jgi:hypothetical protein
VILLPGARRDVRRAAVRRGVQPAARQACCPGPASLSAQVSLSVQVWLPVQARRGEPQARLAKETALPSEQA